MLMILTPFLLIITAVFPHAVFAAASSLFEYLHFAKIMTAKIAALLSIGC
jgi:hypothetical protein